ncbi:hypothetical protein GWI33_001836 [Rhynchophorus ferrugineus]|uniref:Uncharacterized protein n=1 Tax=Rhynchophorus ferrugineus TaxID=354439 RepID=A0A834IPX2_RHYFE|nr:hypothetical protein GWI33_001836 [Rhynchophorus ferrugineus]
MKLKAAAHIRRRSSNGIIRNRFSLSGGRVVTPTAAARVAVFLPTLNSITTSEMRILVIYQADCSHNYEPDAPQSVTIYHCQFLVIPDARRHGGGTVSAVLSPENQTVASFTSVRAPRLDKKDTAIFTTKSSGDTAFGPFAIQNANICSGSVIWMSRSSSSSPSPQGDYTPAGFDGALSPGAVFALPASNEHSRKHPDKHSRSTSSPTLPFLKTPPPNVPGRCVQDVLDFRDRNKQIKN